MDLDAWIEHVRECKPLPEHQLKHLCMHVSDILIEEPNCIQVPAPVTICGDIHGQFHDLLELFRIGGPVGENTYIFMGDYVDRGYHSLETMTLMLLYKAKFPNQIFLLRGNHESRLITKTYGFYEEVERKYGNGSAWRYLCDVFDCLNLAALVSSKILCVHGGLSPNLNLIEEIQTIERRQEVPREGSFSDLLWSDPEDSIETWEVSMRGAGWRFGGRVGKDFCHINDIDLLCRAHQMVNEGYMYHFGGEQICTVWSAPNYYYRCGNLASILKISADLERSFRVFDCVEENHEVGKIAMEEAPIYFV